MDVLKHFINYTCVRISYFECLCNWLQTWNPLLNNSWNFGFLASSRVKTLLIGLDLALEWSKLSSDMALATEITEHIWSVFTILRPSKLLQVKLLFFLVILTPKKENKRLTQFEPWAREVWVTCLNLATIWLYQNLGHPLQCLILHQFWNCLTCVGCSMSKWPEKNRIWFASLNMATESSKPNQVSWALSVKMAIFWNAVDHFEAKHSPISNFFTFSGHLDTRLSMPVKKKMNFDSIWAREVGVPSGVIDPLIPLKISRATPSSVQIWKFWTHLQFSNYF